MQKGFSREEVARKKDVGLPIYEEENFGLRNPVVFVFFLLQGLCPVSGSTELSGYLLYFPSVILRLL